MMEELTDNCAICGTDQGPFEAHHLKHRGTHPALKDDPANTINICPRCHRAIHEGKLKVGGARNRFRAWRIGKDGEEVEFIPWGMLKPPAEVVEKVQALERSPIDIETIVKELRTWNDMSLAHLDQLAKDRKSELSELRCTIIGVLYERYISWGMSPRDARVSAGKLIGESTEMVHKLLSVWTKFISQGVYLRDWPALRLTHFIIAAGADEPVKALEYTAEIKERGVRLSTRAQRELQLAGRPEVKEITKDDRLRSCMECQHYKLLPREAVIVIFDSASKHVVLVESGVPAGERYCTRRHQLGRFLGNPIEVGARCEEFEWRIAREESNKGVI